jgi:hypothetical protein
MQVSPGAPAQSAGAEQGRVQALWGPQRSGGAHGQGHCVPGQAMPPSDPPSVAGGGADQHAARRAISADQALRVRVRCADAQKLRVPRIDAPRSRVMKRRRSGDLSLGP